MRASCWPGKRILAKQFEQQITRPRETRDSAGGTSGGSCRQVRLNPYDQHNRCIWIRRSLRQTQGGGNHACDICQRHAGSIDDECIGVRGARRAGQQTGSLRPPLPMPEYPRLAANADFLPDRVSIPRERSQAGVLTIEQLEQMAAANNPTLAQASQRVRALQGEQVQVGLYPNPVVGYQAEEIGENGQAGQHGMYLRQEIVTANKLGLNRAVVSHEVEQARWDYEIQQRRVSNAVRSQAYEVLAAQRTLEFTDALVGIGKAAVETADKLYQASQVSQVDVLQARVEANSARLQLAAARKTHEAAWRRLVIVIGMPDMQPAPLADSLDDDLPNLVWNETARQLLEQSPQVAHARSEVERAPRRGAGLCRADTEHGNRRFRALQRRIG